MKVKIKTNDQKLIPLVEELRDFVWFCLSELGIDNCDTEILIKLLKNPIGIPKIYGQCDYKIGDPKFPVKFLVRIRSKLPLKYILLTIAHELVHVKQYLNEELTFDILGFDEAGKEKVKYYWFGEEIPEDDGPDEDEARALEYVLVKSWIDCDYDIPL